MARCVKLKKLRKSCPDAEWFQVYEARVPGLSFQFIRIHIGMNMQDFVELGLDGTFARTVRPCKDAEFRHCALLSGSLRYAL